MVTRGEVWLVALDPTVGREIKKTRPAVVVSPDELNGALDTVIVSPMTTAGSGAPYRVPVTFGGKRGLVLAEQLRAIDKQRLLRRIGRIPGKVLAQTLRVYQEMFAE
ncbi:MAG: type II toxin-antitoxin system PemK/MazF family toxin [Candidatus Eremiobacteraeota bacterium]|nr:type II toxin-antitoxin system PemK/MazF family toxin [Candidatus Eremiobacteraeota bacterium]